MDLDLSERLKFLEEQSRNFFITFFSLSVNMPKTAKKSYKKKSSSWLTKYKPKAKTVYRPNVGIGRSLFTKLRTEFFFNAPCTSGVFNGFLNVGSCFDPTGDLATIQPAGFDQLAALYARYLVIGGTCSIECVGTYSIAAQPTGYTWVAASYPSTLSTALTTYQAAASQPYAKTCTFNATIKGKMMHKWNTQQIVGSRLPVVAEDCGALVGASPATGENVIIPIRIDFQQGTTAGCLLKIQIIQDVIFDQRIQVVDA